MAKDADTEDTRPVSTKSDDDVVKDAKEAFTHANEAENENRKTAEDDLRFARLGTQWDAEILRQREEQRRPALTINKMPSFIRQVVNETRQNNPSIKARPVDGGADVETAQVINGLIRNIEYNSRAHVAYDTAADFAVSMGFGYIRVDVDYAHDDTFDQDILVKRISNPFNVFGDPYSDEMDSSDWNSAFVVEPMPHKEFERRYKGSEPVDWVNSGYGGLSQPWFDDDSVMVAEWWVREEYPRTIYQLSNGDVVDETVLEEHAEFYAAQGLMVENKRPVKSHKVTHYLLTGAEVLERTEWPGRYIPIIPVYGEDINVKGRRYLRSLIADAKDSQRMFNYWRTASTELVALAPKAPWVGPEEAFTGQDARKWETANVDSHSFIAYAGEVPPQRQPFGGVPAGSLQEALNANDDMKAVIGIYDPSLGARSNETSGRAIIARQRESDTATFHFPDNLNVALSHTGRVMLDLIPHVYNTPRIIRVIGEDDTVDDVEIGERAPILNNKGEAIGQIYDLTVGKYDVVMDEGPSYATQRQESADQMLELIRVFPQAAPVIGDLLVKNLDWPGADEISDRLRKLAGVDEEDEDPRIGQAMQMIQALQQQLAQAQDDKALEMAKIRLEQAKAAAKAENDRAQTQIKELDAQLQAINDSQDRRIDSYNAESQRITALSNANGAMNPPGPYDEYE